MDNEKLIEILRDKEFAKKILVMETAEEVQNAFKEKGVEISLEEIGTLGTAINKVIEKGGELSEEELQEISGGHVGYNAASFLAGIYYSVVKDNNPSVTRGLYIAFNPGEAASDLTEEDRIISGEGFNHKITNSDIIAFGLGEAVGAPVGHIKNGVKKVIKWAKN